MKTIQTVITVVFTISCHLYIKAQQREVSPSQWIDFHKKNIKDAPYIFEGKVIQQKKYYGKRMRNVLTCSVVQITKIFKGSPELKLGTIKVITEQGGQVDANGTYYSIADDGGGGIGKGWHYIIFGVPVPKPGVPDLGDRQPLDSNALKSIVTDNLMMLNMINLDVVVIYAQGAQWDNTRYKAIDSLYSFFKENGLTVQEEQK